MTRRDRPTGEPGRREPGAPAAARAEPYLLTLQRAAGNQAVARLVARQPKPDKSDSSPRAGGWNEKPQAVGGSHRFPVTGVTRGNQTLDKQGGTPERAAGSAVVVVPDGADLAKPFEVLLLFHGVGIGYRERTTTAPMDAGGPGTVRDVEDDLIPQQLSHSGRNIVGVLAQGLMYGSNRFNIADPGGYVEEVLELAAPQIKQELPAAHVPDAPKPLRTVFAGHSGGGIVAVEEAGTGTPKAAPADKAEWLARPRLFVFDGIHNSDQRDEVLGVVRRWVREDVAFLAGQADPVVRLDERKLKFRSTFSTGGWKGYTGWNIGGEWDDPVMKDGKQELDENQKPKFAHKSVKAGASLRALIAVVIDGEAAKAKPAVIAKLKEQYVVEGPLQAEHERTMGVGAPPESRKEKRDPAPGGLTAPADKGVPAYSGGGHLEKALERLSDDTKIGRVAPRRWTEQQIEDSRRAATTQAEVSDADRHGRPTAESRARQAMEDELGGRAAVDSWFAGHVPNATFMGYEIGGNRGSASPGVHQRMLALLQRAEARLVAQGMPRAGEAPPATPADPQLAAFRISDVSGLREPSPPTDMASGVSMHCYGMAVDFNVAADPFVRHSGSQMVGRAMLLVEGKDYILDGAAGHGTPSEAWDSLHAGSEALKTYFTLNAEQIRAKLTEHPNAAAKGDAAWWAEQIRLDRTDPDRRKNWVGGSPTAGFMDLPKAFVTILADAGLTWGGTYAGGKDIMHFDGRDDFRAQRQR